MIPTSEEHNDDDTTDFLSALMIDEGEDENQQLTETEDGNEGATGEDNSTCSNIRGNEVAYRSKKPKWWIQLSGRPSKAQRRAMREMESHMLVKPPYGELIDWRSVFPTTDEEPIDDIWLEIGFGSGENLLRLAEQYSESHPRRFFVGAEIHASGVGNALKRIQGGIQEKKFWKDYTLYSEEIDPASRQCGHDHEISGLDSGKNDLYHASTKVQSEEVGEQEENPYSNLRIHRGDGVKLLSYIPAGTLSSILVTHPDPFPKEHQIELRVIQTHTVRSFRRLLRPGGRLYLATDDPGYFEWSVSVLDLVNENDTPIFVRVDPCPHRKLWLPVVSFYEQRGWKNGRHDRFCCWEAV